MTHRTLGYIRDVPPEDTDWPSFYAGFRPDITVEGARQIIRDPRRFAGDVVLEACAFLIRTSPDDAAEARDIEASVLNAMKLEIMAIADDDLRTVLMIAGCTILSVAAVIIYAVLT